jgi:hypothetical protein
MRVITFLVAVIMSFSGCTINNEASRMNSTYGDGNAIGVIRQYITEHKRWKPTDYRIEEDRHEGRYVVYTVLYLADAKMLYPGGGESIEVYYDPRRRKIVKELGFQ